MLAFVSPEEVPLASRDKINLLFKVVSFRKIVQAQADPLKDTLALVADFFIDKAREFR